jgi:3-dehydroquinate synthase
VLIVTRALPILAEAAVLLMGAARLPWRQFLPAIMLSNLGIALVYSILGRLARDRGQLLWAIAVSIALPLLATTMARLWLARTSTPTQLQ